LHFSLAQTYSILRKALDDSYEEDAEWRHLTAERKWLVLREMFDIFSSTESALHTRQQVLDDLDILKEVTRWWNNAITVNGMMDKRSYFYVNSRIFDILVLRPL
jgi:hypothetical protein